MDTSNTKKAPGRWTRFILDLAEEVAIAIIILVTACMFFLRIVTVTGPSMEPNYREGDCLLVVNTLGMVGEGDVVVIVDVLEEPIIKRVIAKEGQTVDFDLQAQAVLIDGEPLDDSQFGVENGITGLPYTTLELLDFPQTVPEGCVFVLGDNRPVSEDSRFKDVGMVNRQRILGKAVFRLAPDFEPIQ